MVQKLSDTLKYDQNGFVTVIAQEWRTGEILMVAFANREAVEKTLETGYVHYYSRSRQQLWLKGETSGALQLVKEIRVDCDRDALLIQIDQQKGVACHTGARSCFFDIAQPGHVVFSILDRLDEVIESRRHATSGSSYVKSLFEKGEDTQLKKVGEEAVEFACAVKDNDPDKMIAEAADVVFHLAVALADKGISFGKVKDELARRFGTSGITEKASRQPESLNSEVGTSY